MEKPVDIEEHKKFLRSHSNNNLVLITSMILASNETSEDLKLIEV
jgi:hypothetical protein